MANIGDTCAIRYIPGISLWSLPWHKERPQAVWGQNPMTSAGIDSTKIKLAVTAQATESIDELIRLAAKHIHAMAFLAVSEQDERIIDRLVARQPASTERKPITRRA